MFGAPAEGATFQDLTWNEKLAFGILTALIVVIGVYPQAVIDFVGPSLESMMGSLQVSNAVVK